MSDSRLSPLAAASLVAAKAVAASARARADLIAVYVAEIKACIGRNDDEFIQGDADYSMMNATAAVTDAAACLGYAEDVMADVDASETEREEATLFSDFAVQAARDAEAAALEAAKLAKIETKPRIVHGLSVMKNLFTRFPPGDRANQ